VLASAGNEGVGLGQEAAGEVATSDGLARKSELSSQTEPGGVSLYEIGHDLFGEEPRSMAPVASTARSPRPDICIFLTSLLLTGGRRGIHRRDQGGVRAPVGVPARWCGRLSPRERPAVEPGHGGELGTLCGTPGGVERW
jgi:hypothetical protein